MRCTDLLMNLWMRLLFWVRQRGYLLYVLRGAVPAPLRKSCDFGFLGGAEVLFFLGEPLAEPVVVVGVLLALLFSEAVDCVLVDAVGKRIEADVQQHALGLNLDLLVPQGLGVYDFGVAQHFGRLEPDFELV